MTNRRTDGRARHTLRPLERPHNKFTKFQICFILQACMSPSAKLDFSHGEFLSPRDKSLSWYLLTRSYSAFRIMLIYIYPIMESTTAINC